MNGTSFVLDGYSVVITPADEAERTAWSYRVTREGRQVAVGDCFPSRVRAERHARVAVDTDRCNRALRVVFAIETPFGGLDDLSNFTAAQATALEAAFALERGE